MKRKNTLLFLAICLCTLGVNAQIELKTEYIGSSDYKDKVRGRTGGEGSAMVTSLGINIPFSVHFDENKRPTVWSASIGGSYTSLDNKNDTQKVSPSEILNTQMSLIHLRPINSKWSLMAVVGVGTFAGHAQLDKIRMTNVMAYGTGMMIWKKDNLSLGAGISINNAPSYPMIFPALYVNWQLEGKYEVSMKVTSTLELSAGMRLTKFMKLHAAVTTSGSLALDKVDGKRMMLTHQYFVAGLRPEFNFGKFVVPINVGISSSRKVKYKERKFKSIFNFSADDGAYYDLAPYISAGLKYKFF